MAVIYLDIVIHQITFCMSLLFILTYRIYIYFKLLILCFVLKNSYLFYQKIVILNHLKLYI